MGRASVPLDYTDAFEYYDAHRVEVDACISAEEGDYAPLAKLIQETGELKTEEARNLAARLVKDLPRTVRRRTIDKQAQDVAIYSAVRRIQVNEGCSEYRAKLIFLEQHVEFNEETLKTIIRRAKDTIQDYFGRRPPW